MSCFNNNCCCNPCYNSCCVRDRCCLVPIPGPQGIQGPRGATGETGPQGPIGPAGPAFNTYGSFYNPSEQVLTTGTPVALTNTITASNLALAGSSIVIPTSGSYLINYGVNTVPTAVAGNNIFLAINGVGVAGTERALSNAAGTSSSTILSLVAGNILTLMPTAAGAIAVNIGAPSAQLSITRIS